MERPLGGATTIPQAQKYLAAAEDRSKVWDQWYMFQAISENILADDSIENKRAAMAKAIREFEALLGTTKARSQRWQALKQKAERRCDMTKPAKSLREVTNRLMGVSPPGRPQTKTLKEPTDRLLGIAPSRPQAKSVAEAAKILLGGGIQIKSHDPKRGQQTFRSVFNDLVIDAQIRRSLQVVVQSMVLKSLRSQKR